MALNCGPALDAVESKLGTLGVFDTVNMHEPENAPGTGVTASVWVEAIRPIPRASGLPVTSSVVDLSIRIQRSMQTNPQNQIDRDMAAATDAVINAFSGDFDLGGSVSHVDLLGAYGPSLSARAGYLKQDSITFRVMVVTVPLVFFDVWTQVS